MSNDQDQTSSNLARMKLSARRQSKFRSIPGELMELTPPHRTTFCFVKTALALSMVIPLGNSNLYFSTAISNNSWGFSAIILFISRLNFMLRNLSAALLRVSISRPASHIASLEVSVSSTLEDRELGRDEACCLGDAAWDLTGGDTMDCAG